MEKLTGGCPGRLAMRSASASAVAAAPAADTAKHDSASTAARAAPAVIGWTRR